MSYIEESVEVSKISRVEDKLTNNGKEDIVINIEEIPIVDELTKQLVDSGKVIEQHVNGNQKEVILAVENENQDNVDQRKVVFQSVDKQPKTPYIWVQYLRGTDVKDENSPGKQIETGRRSGPGGRNYQYQGGGGGGGGGFNYDPSRNSFLLLVFTILLVMLALTFLYNVLVLNTPGMLDFYRTNRRPLSYISSGVLIAMSYAMICCLPCMRVTPCNYIALLIVVAAMSNVTAVLTAYVSTKIVLFALVGTSVTVAFCLLLALSRFDFTAWYLYAVVIGTVVAVLSIVVLIAKVAFDVYFRPLHLAVLYALTLIQVILLIMELQMVLGGRSIEINEEDHVLAAYLLYMSIVNLFIQILQILADLEAD